MRNIKIFAITEYRKSTNATTDGFVIKEKVDDLPTLHETIRQVVVGVRTIKRRDEDLCIDFHPFHDIEMIADRNNACRSLSKKEIDEFWRRLIQ